MRKNHRSLLAACGVIAILLTGCAGGHTHQASDIWEADPDSHWKTCSDCGQVLEKGAHTPDDSDICTVCNAQVIDWGYSKSVYQFNEYGECTRSAEYDEDGNRTTETICTYEYDADGNLLYCATAVDGVLEDETNYTLIGGESAIREYVYYMDDGTKSVSAYDENGNITLTVFYDADGNEYSRTESEYALSADGMWYETVNRSTEADGSVYVMEFSEMGDQTGRIIYDAEGNLISTDIWEYTYDEDGNWQTRKSYCNGVLTEEIIFATVKSDDGSMTYPETVTEYDESGAKNVTVYDENNQVVSETHYDANGAVID